jgi:hypothetical protein
MKWWPGGRGGEFGRVCGDGGGLLLIEISTSNKNKK